MKHSWDIFCSVIDNFGDAGVCWRLARQLSSELGQNVRLWVDELNVVSRLCPAVDSNRSIQLVAGVEIRRWGTPFTPVQPADFVIEGFGAALPDVYLEAMAARAPRAVWINLEYLSAEQWVEGCHRLPSPHAHLPLVKYFFFPGFTRATGGLLFEADLALRRDAFQNNATARSEFWRSLNLRSSHDQAPKISLFCYDNNALENLINAWSSQGAPITCVVPEGRVLAQLNAITGRALSVGDRVDFGSLALHAIPFLKLDDYDKLLWACDFNFVRGEDSFVRAQLAGKPLLWQAYPQTQDAHMAKVAAFVERYSASLAPATRSAIGAAFNAWNGESGDMGRLWADLYGAGQPLRDHARTWANQLLAGGNLAVNLAEFCESRLQ